MNLDEKREAWEKGCIPVLVVSEQVEAGQVFVVLDIDKEYTLHRYFPIGENWEVSIDISNSTLENCLQGVTEAFESSYPNNP